MEGPLSSQNSPFLKIFHSVANHPLLRLISCNLTTRCLAVTGDDSVRGCNRLSQPSWRLRTVQLYLLTYLFT